MKMTARRSASMPHIGNNLSGLDRLPHRDTDAGAMCVQRFQSVTVVKFHMESVTASPTVGGIGDCYGTGCSNQEGRAFRRGDVGAAMVDDFTTDGIGAIPKRRDNIIGEVLYVTHLIS